MLNKRSVFIFYCFILSNWCSDPGIASSSHTESTSFILTLSELVSKINRHEEDIKKISKSVKKIKRSLAKSNPISTEPLVTPYASPLTPDISPRAPFLIPLSRNDPLSQKIWAVCIQEILRMKHPFFAAFLTLAFFALHIKMLNTQQEDTPSSDTQEDGLFPRSFAKKCIYTFYQAAIANILNSSIPFFSSFKSKNGWYFMGMYICIDAFCLFLDSYSSHSPEKNYCTTFVCFLRDKVKNKITSFLPPSLKFLFPTLTKALLSYAICPSIHATDTES